MVTVAMVAKILSLSLPTLALELLWMVEEGWEECIEISGTMETNMVCYHINQKCVKDGQLWVSIAYFGIGFEHGWLGKVGKSSDIQCICYHGNQYVAIATRRCSRWPAKELTQKVHWHVVLRCRVLVIRHLNMVLSLLPQLSRSYQFLFVSPSTVT